MDSLKKSFFGYSKSTVEVYIQRLELEKSDLKEQLKRQENVIEQLKEEIKALRLNENMISSAILDAKHLSKNIVKDAHIESENLKNKTQLKINQQWETAQNELNHIERIKEQLLQTEKAMHKELLNVLHHYTTTIENVDLNQFESSANNISETVKQTEEKMREDLKFIASFPKANEVIVEEAIPVYSFEE